MNHLRFFDVFFTALFLQVTFFSFTQNVAINSTGVTAHSSAILDITATDKGILIPRVSLTAEMLQLQLQVLQHHYWFTIRILLEREVMLLVLGFIIGTDQCGEEHLVQICMLEK